MLASYFDGKSACLGVIAWLAPRKWCHPERLAQLARP
jgi:hypothetical protein